MTNTQFHQKIKYLMNKGHSETYALYLLSGEKDSFSVWLMIMENRYIRRKYPVSHTKIQWIKNQVFNQLTESIMKIFELRWNPLGEKEWVAANTNIEALKIYLSMTETDIIDLDNEDEIVEVPEEKWFEMFVINTDYDRNDPDDWIEKTFAEWMKENKTPGIIAGTVY